MTIAVDLGLAALGNTDAASPPTGDDAAPGTAADLADLFQSLVDDLSAATNVSTVPSGPVPANGRSSKSDAMKQGDGAAAGGDARDPDAAEIAAALSALLGLGALPAPVDLSNSGAASASRDASSDTSPDTSKDARIDGGAAGAPGGNQPTVSSTALGSIAADALASTLGAQAGTAAETVDGLLNQQAAPSSDASSAGQAAAALAAALDAQASSTKVVPSDLPSTPGKTGSPTPGIPSSAAGKALARALSALVGDEQSQMAARTVEKAAASTSQNSAAGEQTESPTSTNAGAATSAKVAGAGAAGTYSFASAAKATEAPHPQLAASEGTSHPVIAPDSHRASEAAQSAARATIEVDLDASLAKARQAAVATQEPARTDGMQIQAAQGGQQASIGLATPVVMTAAADGGTVADQIVKAIRIQVRDGIGEVRLRLQPEHMGEVEISLKVDRDRVSAVLHVERPEVRAQIEGQGQTLRAGLAAQGLHLEELTVRDDGQQRRDGGQRGGQDTPERRRKQSTTKQFELDDPA